jgi:hypothetical protein
MPVAYNVLPQGTGVCSREVYDEFIYEHGATHSDVKKLSPGSPP